MEFGPDSEIEVWIKEKIGRGRLLEMAVEAGWLTVGEVAKLVKKPFVGTLERRYLTRREYSF